MANSLSSEKVIASVRVATSVFFVLFAEYKLAGPGFAHGGFQHYLHNYIATEAVSFYRSFLVSVVSPNAVYFGYAVGVIEAILGVSLLLGLWVRAASVLGILYMLNLTLATWWAPGHNAPLWRYFGAELSHLPLLLLFIVFYVEDAGRVWGLDARRS